MVFLLCDYNSWEGSALLLLGQSILGVLHTLPQTARAVHLGGIAPHAETSRAAKTEYQPVDLVLMNNHGSTEQQKIHNPFPQPARFLQC